mmetsp:Transcript_28683/g.95212  ORF Transcript_28683/g.95212 Transcript_28683/m.95212 type:complete len:220 (+) Transcript_28683:69-728(+)
MGGVCVAEATCVEPCIKPDKGLLQRMEIMSMRDAADDAARSKVDPWASREQAQWPYCNAEDFVPDEACMAVTPCGEIVPPPFFVTNLEEENFARHAEGLYFQDLGEEYRCEGEPNQVADPPGVRRADAPPLRAVDFAAAAAASSPTALSPEQAPANPSPAEAPRLRVDGGAAAAASSSTAPRPGEPPAPPPAEALERSSVCAAAPSPRAGRCLSRAAAA